MSLQGYFDALIKRVEESDLQNNGKDKNGFFVPTRTVVLRHLNLLRDLHDKPRARDMVKESWAYIVGKLPPEWLILTEDQKVELRRILYS